MGCVLPRLAVLLVFVGITGGACLGQPASTGDSASGSDQHLSSADDDTAIGLVGPLNQGPVHASALLGQEIFGPDGESIGEVSDIVLQEDGETRAALIHIGGFLGVGEKEVAVPFDQIEVRLGQDGEEPRLTIALTREELEQLPAWQDPSESAAAEQIAAAGSDQQQTTTTTSTDQSAASASASTTDGDTQATASTAQNSDQQTAALSEEQATELSSQEPSAVDLIGSGIYRSEEEIVGEVDDVIFDQGGSIQAVIVDVGRFLGVGEKPVAIDAESVDVTESVDGDLRLIVHATQEQLEAAPSYSETLGLPVDEVEDPRIVEFLFATNRQPDPAQATSFNHGRSTGLTFGAARVRVPEDHKIGHLELPGWRRILFIPIGRETADPTRHFVVQDVSTLAEQEWIDIARSAGSERDALIFVHGFNTTFEEAVLRTAQIVWDLQYRGAPILFSWPSRGGVLSYAYDQNSALTSRASFVRLLRMLQKDAGIDRINVIAHSMGNLVVLDALATLASTSEPVEISELIMAAPDVDEDYYRQMIPEVRRLASGLTLYASSADKPMQVAREIAQAMRAGDLDGDRPILLDGVDEIDVTAIGDELFGLNHNTFASQRSLINDIKILVQSGTRPPHKRLAEILRMPEGSSEPLFWKYAP